MPCDDWASVFWRPSVSESYHLRKRGLECLRLAADCKQLARDAQSPALQSHFLRMAKLWPALADDALVIPGRVID